MPTTMPAINHVAPYSTDVALLTSAPSCPTHPEFRTLTALWFIITWPMFITWLVDKLCFKRAAAAESPRMTDSYVEDHNKPTLTITDEASDPKSEPSESPVFKVRRSTRLDDPVTKSVHALLTTEGQTARALLLLLAPTTLTKNDINTSLYKLKAKSKAEITFPPKGAPRWTLA
jgi:hypothetical protein